MSVTYAACLEQAGLRPLLWIVEGHALAGFMRDDEAGVAESVSTEVNPMLNLVRSGRAVPVEAAFYGSDAANLFAGAVKSAARHFDHPDSLLGLVAIAAVRREGVRPLPSVDDIEARVEDAPRKVEQVADPLAMPSELVAVGPGQDAVFDPNDTSPPRVRRWKSALLDLSTRNRLLNLRASRQVIDLEVPIESLSLLDDLVHQGVPLRLRAQDELGDLATLQGVRRAQDADPAALRKLLEAEHTLHAHLTAARYHSVLRSLQRSARTLLEETGDANLYLALGTLIHRTSSGTNARAPLFLVPARLEGGTGRSEFRVTVDRANTAAPNHCLVEWLRIKHDVKIPALSSPRLDDSGLDIPHALQGIRAALVDHNLDFRVEETASLAICQFSTFGMWRDLEDHWDELSKSPVVEHLALRPGESFRDPRADSDSDALAQLAVDEASVPVPIPADGSQLKAVALAADGRTFVLEGPPGTGKSQTITNLIAHALDRGKTVLFVAEKQAALEVVKRRLEKVGLGPFALDLHGRDQQPKLIREQLKLAMDYEAPYDPRGWETAQARYRSRHVPLAEYPGKVHGKNGLDYSLWGAASNLEQLESGPTADIPTTYADRPTVGSESIQDAIVAFSRASAGAALSARAPWAIVGAAAVEVSAEAVVAAMALLSAALEGFEADPRARSLATLVPSLSDLSALVELLERRADVDALPAGELQRIATDDWRRERTLLQAELERFEREHTEVLELFRPAFLADGDDEQLVTVAEGAMNGLLGKKKRQHRFNAVADAAVVEGHALDPADAQRLTIQLAAAREHAQRLTADAAVLIGARLSRHWSPLRREDRDLLAATLDAFDEEIAWAAEHPQLTANVASEGPVEGSTRDVMRHLVDAAQGWLALLGASERDHERWLDGRPWIELWLETAPVWAADIRENGALPVWRWAKMIAALEPLVAAGLDQFRAQLLTGAIAAPDAELAFLRGKATTSIRERRQALGLELFNAEVQDGAIVDFDKAADALREEQKRALPAALVSRRSFRAGDVGKRAGQLRRSLDAKRNATSFRQLMETYSDLILEATPCVFVSPASLAKFIPPGSATFDLVVFDEASQVTVPQAIGALGRGRAAVVVGDSQQMPPTAVGKAGIGSGTEDDDGDDEPQRWKIWRAFSLSASSPDSHDFGCPGTTAVSTNRLLPSRTSTTTKGTSRACRRPAVTDCRRRVATRAGPVQPRAEGARPPHEPG